MCRSVAQGGRRCRCRDGGAARRAKDRARKAAKRAEERALRSGVGTPAPLPPEGRPFVSDLAAMSTDERTALIDSRRGTYWHLSSAADNCWKALDDWEPSMDDLGDYADPWEQRIGMERDYVAAVRDAGQAVAVVVDARMIDELAKDGLSPTSAEDHERIALEIGGTKFLTELDKRKELTEKRRSPEFSTMTAEHRREVIEQLDKLDSGAAGRRFRDARLAWLDADARREEIRQRVVRDEISSAVLCGGVPVAANFFTGDYEPGTETQRYGWKRTAPEDFEERVSEVWRTYPDALMRSSVERLGDMDIHYASAGRVRLNPSELRRGPVDDAVTLHYPASITEGLDGVRADTSRAAETGAAARLEVAVSREGLDSLFVTKDGHSVDVGAATFDDDAESRKVLEDYVSAVNASGGITGPDGSRKDLEIATISRSTSMETPTGLVLVTSDPCRSEDPETLRGTGPVMTTGGDAAPTFHEIGHYVEVGNPQIYIACRRFRDDRCAGYERVDEIPGVGKVCSADLVDPYVSAVYPGGRTTEVFTIGMESVFCGKYGGLTGEVGSHDLAFNSTGPRADEEHRELILGLLLASGARQG